MPTGLPLSDGAGGHRGRPFAWAESAPAGAYGWALGGLTTTMERAVEAAAHELADACFAAGDVDGA